MIKRKLSFAMLACLLVAMVVLMAVPMVSSAAIDVTGVNWYGTTYVGPDTFYGVTTNLNAYEAGSKAKVAFNIVNSFAYTVNIKGVTVKFDWGEAYAATSFPAVLTPDQGGVVLFDFTVPSTEGINATVHGYEVKVAYESADAPAIVTSAVDQAFGNGAVNQVVTLSNAAVAPNSIVVYVNGGLWTSGYSQNLYDHSVTFTTAVTAGQIITIYYKYGELLFDGNGSLKAGYLDNIPAAAIDAPFIRDTVAKQHNPVAADGYTVDLNSGRVALTAAVATHAWQSVYVSYTYYPTWTTTGTDFAVYSADQADAQGLAVQLGNMNNNTPQTWLPFATVGSQAKEASDVLKAQADTKYMAGDFAGAKTDYQAAIDKLNEANTANATLSTTTETGLMGLLSGADGVVNAYADKLKGEASMDKNVGVFYIMLGVGILLAGLASIVWAFSRLIDARGPAHHEHI